MNFKTWTSLSLRALHSSMQTTLNLAMMSFRRINFRVGRRQLKEEAPKPLEMATDN